MTMQRRGFLQLVCSIAAGATLPFTPNATAAPPAARDIASNLINRIFPGRVFGKLVMRRHSSLLSVVRSEIFQLTAPGPAQNGKIMLFNDGPIMFNDFTFAAGDMYLYQVEIYDEAGNLLFSPLLDEAKTLRTGDTVNLDLNFGLALQ